MAQQQIPQQQQTPRERLPAAVEDGNIDGLYECIKDDPHILDGIDKIPFVDTPLHIAASAGHAHFALEMMRLMPSFSKKLNPQGLSPLDLALRKREDLPRNLEDLREKLTQTIRELINFDKELIRVKGRESFTPLHYVAEKGDIDLLAEFLLACPRSITDRTIRDETALHIAVKNSKLEACEVLLGWLRRSLNQNLLNSKDDRGNTVLHIAVSNSEIEVNRILQDVKFKDQKWFKQFVSQSKARTEERLRGSGDDIVAARMGAKLNVAGWISKQMGGVRFKPSHGIIMCHKFYLVDPLIIQ